MASPPANRAGSVTAASTSPSSSRPGIPRRRSRTSSSSRRSSRSSSGRIGARSASPSRAWRSSSSSRHPRPRERRSFAPPARRRTSSALEPLPDAPTELEVYERLGLPWCPPELREQPFKGDPPPLVEFSDLRGDLHCHTTWSDGRASVEEMGRAAQELGYEYLAICDHTVAVTVVPGLTADDVRRQGEEIAAANEALAPFRILRGIECDILPDATLDLPDDVLAELDWVMASIHGGQRQSREQLTRADAGGRLQPARLGDQPPDGPTDRPAAAKRGRPRSRLRGLSRDRHGAGDERATRPPRPERRAHQARNRGGDPDRRLDGRPFHARPRQHPPRPRHGSARLGDGGGHRQHAPARPDPGGEEARRLGGAS